MKVFVSALIFYALVAGEIKGFKGAGEVIRGGKSIPLSEGLEVENGDMIRSYGDSSFKIVLNDGSEIFINGETVLKIDETLLYKGTLFEKVLKKVSILLGRIWFRVKEGAWLNVNTATMVVGVRGTEFETGVAPDASAYTEVERGEVIVITDEERAVQEGERAVFDIIEGFRIESREKAFNPDEWIEERRERFERLRDIVRKRVEEIMEGRVELYKMGIEETEESERKEEWELIPEQSSLVELIEDGIEEGMEFLQREKIKWELKERFEKLRKMWEKRKEAIRLKAEKRREEIRKRMEKRREEIKERMEKLRKNMRR